MAKYKHQCEADVHDGYGVGFHKCSREGTLLYGGHWYCKQHHVPSLRAKYQAARKCQYRYRFTSGDKPGVAHGIVLQKHESGPYCLSCQRDMKHREDRAKIAAYDRIAKYIDGHITTVYPNDLLKLLKLKGLAK